MKRSSSSNVVTAESKHAALSVLIFVSVFVMLQAAIFATRGSSVERLLAHRFSSQPAAALLSFAGVSDAPRAHGNQLVGYARTLTIEAGCNGTETLALLIAALAALRLPWRHALMLLGIGGAAVLALNTLRIAALWWALGTDMRLFDVIHHQIAPAILVSGVGLVVLLATRASTRQQP